MTCRRLMFGWLAVLTGWLAAQPGTLSAQSAPREPITLVATRFGRSRASVAPVPLRLEELPPAVRERVRAVVEKPTLSTRGPIETFNCQPAMYSWLLDHPDRAVQLWRRLGAKCTSIECRGAGHFAWRDDQGSEVRWDAVLSGIRQRVWYAEGQVRPGGPLPAVSVRAVVVLNHAEGLDQDGRPAVRQQLHLILHTDSHAVALAARLLGASAPHVAEQYAAQMQLFFGALAWYLDKHPAQAVRLFEEIHCPAPAGAIAPAGE